MKKLHSVAMVSIAANLTLAPGEFVSVHVQHGYAGAAFTLANDADSGAMSTVHMATVIRDTLEAAGFRTVRVGQTITALHIGNDGTEPLVTIDGKTSSISAVAMSVPLVTEADTDASSRFEGVVVGALAGVLAGHLFSERGQRA